MPDLSTALAVLQQAEYEVPRFLTWMQTHQEDKQEISPKEWTAKLKTIRVFAELFTPLLGMKRAILFGLACTQLPEKILRYITLLLATLKLRLLQRRGLKVISISGSYAKTSTKLILNHQLEGAVHVLITPESVNTPLGIARVILRHLSRKHQVFIAELGAYYPGDIAQLKRFVRPHFCIVTPIGPEHLERFGSLEKVIQSELEIIQQNSSSICAFSRNFQWFPSTIQAVSYGEGGTYSVLKASTTRSGTEALVKVGEQQLQLYLPLFGKHNVENCLPGFWIASQLNIPMEIIKKRTAGIPPVPHRMEPTLTQSHVLILDNGYNTSPETAPRVLDTLAEIPGTNKIVITPGFVEMGEKQFEYNKTLAKQIAKVATSVGIIGTTNKDALTIGLQEALFPLEKVVYAQNEQEATNLLHSQLTPQSIVLYEGGTPEIYQ